MSSITALLPAYNEEISIGSVVLRARQYADRVVVIDDGSTTQRTSPAWWPPSWQVRRIWSTAAAT